MAITTLYNLSYWTILLLSLPSLCLGILVDKNILNSIKNIEQVNSFDCLVILIGHWTAEESLLIQTSLSPGGFLRINDSMPPPRLPLSLHSCNIVMMKSPEALAIGDHLCQLHPNNNCISMMFIMYTGGSVLPSTPPSSPVLVVELRYTPQFMFRVQSFYSWWDPGCRTMYRNIAIHRGETLFRNKVGYTSFHIIHMYHQYQQQD